MIRSIFASSQNLKGIETSNANHLIVTLDNLDEKTWYQLGKLKVSLAITLNAFGPDGCPANPKVKEKLFGKINKALRFNPEEIWIDHFRFDSRWEVNQQHFLNIHPVCNYCQNKNRVEVLKEVAFEAKKLAGNIKLGYFAVPFTPDEFPELITVLGHNHKILGKIFDISSPMLYLQMISKSPDYISQYVNWISQQTEKPILPIIQIKSMPDNLNDTLTRKEIGKAFNEALKFPSSGVCFFCWDHALEKNKTGIIRNLFSAS